MPRKPAAAPAASPQPRPAPRRAAAPKSATSATSPAPTANPGLSGASGPSGTSAPCAAPPRNAGRPRAAEVEARLDELTATAGRLFLAHGYSRVSLEMIAREAHVAVRTIYVKFGGKTGLLGAVLQDKRQQFFASMDMARDMRPLKEVLDDFAGRLYRMITTPEAVALQRMLAAEARSNPELVETFFATGPTVTREAIAQFLQRPDIRPQLRDDLPFEQLPVHLTNCILGDQMSRLLLSRQEGTPEQCAQALRGRMALFYNSVLRQA